MSKRLSLALLALAALSAQAAPPSPGEDDMSRFIADRGLLGQIQEVRTTVADRTSELVVTAMAFLGVPYRRGGIDAETGFDCSGFVRSMYERTVGLVLPRLAKDQAAATQPIDKDQLQPSDLVFFNTMKRAFSHVGIYVGEGKFIHSPKPGAQVRLENMQASYWAHRFDGARRVIKAPPEEFQQLQLQPLQQ
jgi:cell wall-associated NlpC family hydrolase